MVSSKIKFGVGLFVLLLFINILGIGYYILISKGFFDVKDSYNFNSYSAEPFKIGMPVKVSGFEIGKVDKIALLKDGNVKIFFSISKENKRWMMQNSIIMIRKPLIGATQIILYPSVGTSALETGATLETYESDDINEMIYKLQPIVEKLENIVTSVDKITSYMAKDDSELVKIVKNLEEFTTTLNENKSVLTTITGDQNATNSLIDTLNNLPSLINNFNRLSVDINKQIVPELSEFIKDLQNIAKDVQSKLKSLDGIVNSVSGYDTEIESLKNDIKTAVIKSNQILEKVDSFLPDDSKEEILLP